MPLNWNTPARERIAARLDPQPNGCLYWTGYIDPQGYGRLGYRGRRSVPLQQAVHEEFIGPIPDGMVVDHTCHTNDTTCPGGRTCFHRRCGNHEHLEAVTATANAERGNSPWALNARKTHCLRGHEFTPENTHRFTEGGSRFCVSCWTARHGSPPKPTVRHLSKPRRSPVSA